MLRQMCGFVDAVGVDDDDDDDDDGNDADGARALRALRVICFAQASPATNEPQQR